MKAGRASKTAEQMALSRALESRKPAGERVCFDPFAERFLGAGYRALLVARPLRDAVERAIERRFAGHHSYVVARTRHFDECLAAELARGPEQVVILGAGYDSRAHRFADRLGTARVFEVDHPATSAAKQARLRTAPVRLTYVPVDLNAQALDGALRAAGYRDGRRSAFLWEGVTPYLAPAAVDAVLRFIAGSAPGSRVVFDYVLASFIDGTCPMHGARNELERMRRTREPLVFGIPEDGIGAYLAARGFRCVDDVGGEALRDRYFAADSGRYVKPWWRIVRAEVTAAG